MAIATSPPDDRAARRATWALVLAFLALGPAIGGDYGISWDEMVQCDYAALTVDYYASLGRDRRFEHYRDLKYHGPLFEILPELVFRLSGPWPRERRDDASPGPKRPTPRAHGHGYPTYEIRHATIHLAAVLALVGVAACARALGLAREAPYAVAALALMPRFMGEAFNNGKDIPFLCAWTWSVWAIVRATRGPHAGSCRACALAGGLVGAALAIRVAAVLLVALGAAAIAAHALTRRPLPGPLALAGRLAAFGGAAYLVMLAGWPWIQLDPLRHPVYAVLDVVHLQTRIPVRFGGADLWSDALPRHYPLTMLAIGTPLPVLALALTGLASALCALARAPAERGPCALLVVWLALPLGLFAVLGNNVYDGVRHFLFVLPAVALLAARGVGALASATSRARLVRAAATASIAWGGVVIARLHPYPITYYNALVGGTAGAVGRFETEYHAASYRAAAEWTNARARATPGRPLVVLLAANQYIELCFAYYLDPTLPIRVRPLLEPSDAPLDADYYIALDRFGWAALPTTSAAFARTYGEFVPLAHVERDGARFVTIFRRVR